MVENYGAEQMEQLIQKKMEQLKTTDRGLAKSEVVADACERMLLDSDAMIKLQELKNRDQGLWETIKQHIQALLDKVRAMLANIKPTSPEGVALQQMTDVLEQAQAMFEDMVVDAANTYQQTDGETLADGGVNFKKKVGNNNSLWYNKNEIYSPVAWVLNNELLTGAEIVQFNSTLAEIKKQGGQPWKRLNKGEVIVDVGAKLIVAKGTMEQPHILDVISYVGQKETQNNFEIFKESIKDAINIRENRERSVALVEDIVDFYVSLNETELARYYFRDFATAEGYDFYGEGFIRKNNDRSGSGELIERGDSSRNSEGDRKSKKITYQIKENVSSTKTFFESMADMVSQETTELYDRLSEAVEKHYAEKYSPDIDSGLVDSNTDTPEGGETIGKTKAAVEYEKYRHINDHSKAIGTAENTTVTDNITQGTVLCLTEFCATFLCHFCAILCHFGRKNSKNSKKMKMPYRSQNERITSALRR